jgi:hypothetical protein
MPLDPLRGCIAAALVTTFVRGAAAQGDAASANGPTAAPPASDTPAPADSQPRPTLVPALGEKIPEHFQAGEQYYDFSLRGLRLRLDSMKEVDSTTYARLDDELSGLERRRTVSYVLFGAAIVAPLVSWGFFAAHILRPQPSCPPMPSAMSPNFEAAKNAWFECNRTESNFDFTPIAIGAGVSVAAMVSALIVAPKRSEMLEFVNLHNRLTREPIRWQFGYDPARRSAFAGAVVHF